MAGSDGTPQAGGEQGPGSSDVPASGGARRRRPRPAAPPPQPFAPWVMPSVIVGLTVVLLVIVFGSIVGHDDDAATARAPASTTTAEPLPELPRGGRELLPGRRVVSFAGAPQDAELGSLGVGSLRGAVRRLKKQAAAYSLKTRPTQPALQLISTIAHADAGRDGRYNERQSGAVIARHLREARRSKALLILDIQPGKASFVTETRRLRRWLREPDVAIAYDPEWRVERDGDVPGQVIGSVRASELQRSLDEVAKVVRDRRLPKKLVIVHRFTPSMVRGLATIRVPAELQMVMSIDGVGDRANKIAKYRQLTRDLPAGWRPGFKVFLQEDREAGGLMTPRQVMGLRPRPDVVLYE